MVVSDVNPDLGGAQSPAFGPAGFWVRFVAVIIDSMILWFFTFPVSLVMGLISLALGFAASGEPVPGIFSGPLLMFQILSYFINAIIWIGYFAYFYQKKGATPGKLLFNMRVVDAQTGANLNLKQTILREMIGKVLSGLFLGIGYIIAAFREDRKALHDLLAGTQVLRKDV